MDNRLAVSAARSPPPPSLDVIPAATLNAAELLDWQDKVGALEPGHYPDLIPVDGDPLIDITLLQRVKFGMKAASW